MYCKTIRIFNQTIPGTAVGDGWSVHGWVTWMDSVDYTKGWYLIGAWFATLAQPV